VSASWHIVRSALRSEAGSGVISLLATVLIVGLVGALLIPRLTHAGSTSAPATVAAPAKAHDAEAQLLAQTAQTAMATYAAENGSGTTGATAAELGAIEPALTANGPRGPYLASVTGGGVDYTLVAVDPLTRNSFTLSDTGGAVSRTCTTAGTGGCPAGGTW
jgi:hypothetical protein